MGTVSMFSGVVFKALSVILPAFTISRLSVTKHVTVCAEMAIFVLCGENLGKNCVQNGYGPSCVM